MSETINRDDLLALRAEYDQRLRVLHGEIAALRQRPHRRLPGRIAPLLLATLLIALVPLATMAANPFVDLDPGSVHNANIDAIYNAGITTGCDPGVAYCPNDLVTRQEMASFLARTAGLGSNVPVANAKTAQTATTAQTIGTNPAGATTYAANDLVRTAHAVSTYTRDQEPTTPDTELVVSKIYNADTTYDLLATVTITAPTNGFIIVTGTAGLSIEGTGTVGFIRVRDTVATTNNLSPVLTASTNGGPNPTTAVATTLSPTYIFPVAAGQRTFVMELQKTGLGKVSAYDGVITAVFVPFGSGGAATLEGGE
jgi:hypothetical protein